MKKASKILLIIGGIFAILAALMGVGSAVMSFLGMQGYGWFTTGTGVLGYLITSNILADLLTSMISSGTPAEVMDPLIEMFNSLRDIFVSSGIDQVTSIIMIVMGLFILFVSFVALISGLIGAIITLVFGILGLTASGKKAKKGKFIANFVFGALVLFFFDSGFLSFLAALLIIVGSILGLIALKKQPKEEAPIEGGIEEL